MESKKSDWLTKANIVTLSRLVLSPLPGAIIFVAWNNVAARWLALAVFTIICLTDLLDGHLARRFDEVTDIGKIMDPLVDKFLILTTLAVICWLQPNERMIFGLTIVVAVRELVVSFLRYFAKLRGVVIAANLSGKIKMVAQSIVVGLIVAPIPDDGTWGRLVNLAMIIAVWLTIVSGVIYFVKYSSLSEKVKGN
ncbi:CDP-diacylglycerol--glycerol-3-phosphate 3-phosphatidyltransferase [Candidatus Saccharibacteria bacterium]|nr:CDP-diacylglycerol--glycerol-3-phosphate 3-phosphatidyltransferase [Candidatus Saccharibacteria bacterium]